MAVMRRQVDTKSCRLFISPFRIICVYFIFFVCGTTASLQTRHARLSCILLHRFVPPLCHLSSIRHLCAETDERHMPLLLQRNSSLHIDGGPPLTVREGWSTHTDVNHGNRKSFHSACTLQEKRKKKNTWLFPSSRGLGSVERCGVLRVAPARTCLLHYVGQWKRGRRGERSSACIPKSLPGEDLNSACTLSSLHGRSALHSAAIDTLKHHDNTTSIRYCIVAIVHIQAPRLLKHTRSSVCGALTGTSSNRNRPSQYSRNTPLRGYQQSSHVRAGNVGKEKRGMPFIRTSEAPSRSYCGAAQSPACILNLATCIPCSGPLEDVSSACTLANVHSGRPICNEAVSDMQAVPTSMRRKCTSARDYVAAAVLQRLLPSGEGEHVSRLGQARSDECLLSGFLRVTGMPYCVRVREVPGNGDCLFTALAACIWYSTFGAHASLEAAPFKDMTYNLRQSTRFRAAGTTALHESYVAMYQGSGCSPAFQLAVETLGHPTVSSFTLEGDEEVSPAELLHRASGIYGLSSVGYLNRLRLPGVWGGGPEIVALSHALRRTICVYEIDVTSESPESHSSSFRANSTAGADVLLPSTGSYGQTIPPLIARPFRAVADTYSAANPSPQRMHAEILCRGKPLKLVACLGYPANVADEPLHILYIGTSPGSLTNSSAPSATGGDHFMPLFPCLISPD